ncbi:MAG: hypothetical protein DWI57_02495 [Chloroflexi bacterium]|nr:MAG: hypothetical protein DWI57_02495 [Chloroflexota bacterium]
MATEKKKKLSGVPLSSFEELLKDALKLLQKPKELGATLPFPLGYFLYQLIQSPIDSLSADINSLSAEERGLLLYQALLEAAESLWEGKPPHNKEALQAAINQERATPGTSNYSFLLLELRCFRRFFPGISMAAVYEQEHLLSYDERSEHYRNFDIAVQQLATALLKRILPGLRPESPYASAALIGYENAIERVVIELEAGALVMVSGPGGVGKTSVGTKATQEWQRRAAGRERSVFWFTIRPTLNDNLPSLLFALGHFLSKQGAFGLWGYLLAQAGQMEDTLLALRLARHDLSQCSPPPLLCFDELERLRVLDSEDSRVAHTQILEFIEGLRRASPILLIGQRPLLQDVFHQSLSGLATPQILQLWEAAGRRLSAEAATQLFRYTGGNPRLLVLCRNLQQPNESIDDLLLQLPDKPALAAIFQRLWIRLSAEKRHLLQQLSVFRSLAPAERWEKAILQELITQQLVERDGQGGVAILPAFRELIYTDLPGEARQRFHLQAALIRSEMLEYTAAAYHYWQAGEDASAVGIWYPHRESEISKGQASAASTIFDAINSDRLEQAVRELLVVLRAQLARLQGELSEAAKMIEGLEWNKKSRPFIQSRRLLGDSQDALGNPEAAMRSYEQGIETIAQLIGELSELHDRKATIYTERMMDQEAAQQQLRWIEYQYRRLEGVLHQAKGNYPDALRSFQTALLLAQELGDERTIAGIEGRITIIFGVHFQNIKEAEIHANQAITIYKKLGDGLSLARLRSNLAGAYLDCAMYTRAVEMGEDACRYFTIAQDVNYLANALNTVAEAYLELGNTEKAEYYARKLLDELENLQLMPYAWHTLGKVKRIRQEFPDALYALQQSIRWGERNEDPRIVAYSQRELGDICLQLHQLDDAEQNLEAAWKFFAKSGMEKEAEKTRKMMDTLGH